MIWHAMLKCQHGMWLHTNMNRSVVWRNNIFFLATELNNHQRQCRISHFTGIRITIIRITFDIKCNIYFSSFSSPLINMVLISSNHTLLLVHPGCQLIFPLIWMDLYISFIRCFINNKHGGTVDLHHTPTQGGSSDGRGKVWPLLSL